MPDTSNWDKQLVEEYEGFVNVAPRMSVDRLNNRIALMRVFQSNPVRKGENEYTREMIAVAQAELATR